MNRGPVDDVELRVRLIPGVLIVGIESGTEGPVVLTVTLNPTSDLPRVEEELRILVEPLQDVELRVTPLTTFSSTAALLERMLGEVGAVDCSVDSDPETGIRGVRATVEQLRDISRVNDLVAAFLGEEFVRTRLSVELRLPLTAQEPPGRRDE